MIKHVGVHSQKKIVILFRKVPDEEHMCLVTYSDVIPRAIHDDLMRLVESPEGQAAKEFADVLNRNLLSDGRNVLQTLHRDGFIKKVPTNQVSVTPTSNSRVRLDELNRLIDQIALGGDAAARLANLDENVGMRKTSGTKTTSSDVSGEPAIVSSGDGVLSDTDIANLNLSQASTMRANAAQLIAEATRLETEARKFVKVAAKAKVKKTNATKEKTST